MKCFASVWAEILFYQDGVCFLSCSNHCSLSPNWSPLILRGPKLTQAVSVSCVSGSADTGTGHRGVTGVRAGIFLPISQDINKSRFLTKFGVYWYHIKQTKHISSFGPINKINNPQILCSPLFLEGVDLGTNASGFLTFSLVPTN